MTSLDELMAAWERGRAEYERRMALGADGVRCWQCGVEPLNVINTTGLGDPEPTYMPGYWPPGDHEHAVRPPTPDELAERGERVAARIMAIAAE